MADDTPQSDKRHEATPRKRERARRDGQLAVGKDAILVGGTAGGLFALVGLGPALYRALVRLTAAAASGLADPDPSRLAGLLPMPLLLVAAVGLAAGLGAFLATVAQTGGGFWTKLATPDFTRVFSASKLKRWFNGELLADLGLSVLKVSATGIVAWLALRDDFLTLPRLLGVTPATQLGAVLAPAVHAAFAVLAVMAVLAGLELAVTRIRFARKLRMSDEELKRETKEEDGDPLVRSRRRQRHRELMKNRPALEVPRADVVVVNPTHVAVALRYRSAEDRAPRVTAKGKGPLADSIRELAHRHGIPIYPDIPLARLLYRKVKVGREVPSETYKAVAAVLAFVYRVTGRRPGAPKPGDEEARP